jgi:hypothetical protein
LNPGSSSLWPSHYTNCNIMALASKLAVMNWKTAGNSGTCECVFSMFYWWPWIGLSHILNFFYILAKFVLIWQLYTHATATVVIYLSFPFLHQTTFVCTFSQCHY